MLEVLARRRVHAVLSGHLHLREVIAREIVLEAEHESGAEAGTRTVRLVQAGTAASVRERDAGEPQQFQPDPGWGWAHVLGGAAGVGWGGFLGGGIGGGRAG